MSQKMIPFPNDSEFHAGCEHIFQQGGMSMEVKNTHPEYKSEEARVEQLKDTQKACLALIRTLRNTPAKGA